MSSIEIQIYQVDLRGVYMYLYFKRLVHTKMIYELH